MIDGLMKKHIDPLWEAAATPLIRAGITPNQVTGAGLILILLATLAYLWHQSSLLFSLSLIVAFAFDALDGAVARRRDMRSHLGGYFDAVIDRYQEMLVFLALAYVNDLWLLAFLAFSGGMLTSYAKARTAIEMPINNENWPDFFERLERIIFLCALLLVDGAFALSGQPLTWLLGWGLGLYALLAQATALQRARRAAQMLRLQDQADLAARNSK